MAGKRFALCVLWILLGAFLAGLTWWAFRWSSPSMQETQIGYRMTRGRQANQMDYLPFQKRRNLCPQDDGGLQLRSKDPVEIANLYLQRSELDLAVFWARKAFFDSPGVDAANDLAVVLLELSDRDLNYVLEALEILEPWMILADEKPELAFNIALALEVLNLPQMAIQRYRRFQERFPGDPWDTEVKSRLGALIHGLSTMPDWGSMTPRDRLLFGRDMDWDHAISGGQVDGRAFFLEGCIPDWIHWIRAGKGTEADEILVVARKAAEMLLSKQNDPLCRDLLEVFQPDYFSQLEKVAQAIALRKEKKYSKALEIISGLQSASNPAWSLWVRYQTAFLLFQTHQYRQALALIDQGLSHEQMGAYPSLMLENLKLKGLVHGYQRDPYIYLKATQEGLVIGNKLGDVFLIQSLRKNLTEAWQMFGERQSALNDGLDLLRSFGPWTAPKNRRLTAGQMGQNLMDDGKPGLAAYFFGEMVAWARVEGQPSGLAQALRYREKAYAMAGIQRPDALDKLTEAARLAAEIPDEKTQMQAITEIDAVLALCWSTSVPERAVEKLEATRTYFQNDHVGVRLLETELLLGQCYQRLDKIEDAEASYRRGIDLFEEIRPNVLKDRLRIGLMDQAHSLYDVLASLYLDMDRPDDALQITERARARFLLENRHSLVSLGTVEEIQKVIPQTYLVISFYLGPDSISYWAWSQDEHLFGRLALKPKNLVRKIANLNLELESPEMNPDGLNLKLEELSQALFLELGPLFEEKRNLVIIPHNALWDLPFSAMRLKGKWLLESHSLTLAPSLTHFLSTWKQKAERPQGRRNRVLAIGNPAFDRTLYPKLYRLPGAEREVFALQEYPRKILLVGKKATSTAVLEALSQADVLHYAGHVTYVSKDPLQAKLILAPDAEYPLGLDAATLFRTSAQFPEVVVLAGCQSGRAGTSVSERGGNMARPFLAGGTLSVIATIRDISDIDNTTFARDLHHRLRLGLPPSEALRQTQLTHLNEKNPWQPGALWWRYQTFGLP